MRAEAAAFVCALAACQPPAALPPEGAARVIRDERAVSAGAALVPADLACITGPDPELDRESPWSVETGQLLDRALPRLAACSRGLTSGENEITLRLVYGADGTSTSQHVVRSSPGACAAAACLMRELGKVQSPRLLIERNSYDIALVLDGAVIRRANAPPEVIVSDSDPGTGCVDPAIAAFSRSTIKEIVSSSFPHLRSCYGEALVRDHRAAGTVTFEFVIGQLGEVARAQVRDSTLPDCTALQCMLEQFRGLEFPAPVGRSVRVVYPIRYAVEQDSVTLR